MAPVASVFRICLLCSTFMLLFCFSFWEEIIGDELQRWHWSEKIKRNKQ
jgi:hypothetical protein